MAKFFAGVVAGLAFVASSSMTSASPITSQPPALEASGNVTLVFIGYDAADTSFLTEAGSSANIFCNYSEGSCSATPSGTIANLGTQSGPVVLELHDISVANVFDTIHKAPDNAYHASISQTYADLGIFPLPAPALSAINTVLLAHPTGAVWYIGFEDRLNGDYDYNDFVIAAILTPNGVPEPASLMLFGAGLLGLAAKRRRRQLNQPRGNLSATRAATLVKCD